MMGAGAKLPTTAAHGQPLKVQNFLEETSTPTMPPPAAAQSRQEEAKDEKKKEE